ncbi:MAG TPA: GAF domain-containing sensor histidine kinase [Chloroflexota bacterium]
MTFPAPPVEDAGTAVAALRDENRRLRALVDFSRQVTAERNLRAQLRLVCAEVRRATGCSASAVILRSPQQGGIESIESAGLSLTVDADWQQAVRQSQVGSEDQVLPAGLVRSAALPLLIGDDRLGVVLAYDRHARSLSADELAYVASLADAAAMAILNTRLYAQSHRELRRRDALRKVVASISSELDLDSLFGRVIASAVELLDADSGVISLLDADGAARIRAVHNLPPRVVDGVIVPGEGITGRVLQARETVVVEHYREDLPQPALESPQFESGVAVPVWWQGRIQGVFGVLSKNRSRVFTPQDREIMELLANHVAIALENARLYGEVRDRLAEVTGLQAAITALAEELHPERALRVLAEQALSLSGAATVSIELLRPGGRELEVQVAVGEHAPQLAAMRVSVDGSLAGAAVATGKPQIRRAADGEVVARAHTLTDRSTTHSQLVLPLRARGRTLGTLSAYTHHRGAFHLRQVELLTTFANQAAISLDNAQLYAELHNRLEEMVGLQRLGTLLLEEHDFDRVLQSICRQLQRLTDAGGVGIALLEDDPRFLEMRTVVGPSADVLRGARIPTEGSFAAEALRTNRPQRSDDALNDPRGYKKSLALGNTRTILSVPMKTRQRTVGVLSVYNKEGETGFTDRDAELATFFANQAAAAIENARLYEQTREYAVVEERNRLARELHDSVTQSLFSVTLLSEAALNLLDRDLAKARERLERANELAQGALAEMRALIFQLRPMTLQEEGLVSALKKHLSALRSRHGQVVELQVTGSARQLPAPIEDAAFGIVQESLNNVVKHANASHVEVRLEYAEEQLRVSTVDSGVGFDPAEPRQTKTLGMSSMRERAEAVSGRLVVESAPGHGTRITAELPLQPESEREATDSSSASHTSAGSGGSVSSRPPDTDRRAAEPRASL